MTQACGLELRRNIVNQKVWLLIRVRRIAKNRLFNNIARNARDLFLSSCAFKDTSGINFAKRFVASSF